MENQHQERLFEPALLTHDGDRETSPPERGNGSLPWSDLQTEFLDRTPEKKASAEPSTQDGIETVRLCDSLSELASRSTPCIIIPPTVSKAG
jgi:hypothetical protein